MDDRLYFLGFSAFSRIGSGRFRKLINHFRDARSACNADVAELKKPESEIKLQKSLLN